MVKLDNAEADSDTNKPVYSDVAIALMAKLGYVPSRGLGKHSDGIKEPIPVIERPKRLGLGYVLAEDDDMPVPALPPLAPAPQMPLVPPNKDIAEAALEPSNDDGRDIVAEAAEVWKEYVATVPGRDSWGPDSLREETPALMFKRFKEARERLHNKKHLEPKEEPKEEKIAKSSYPEDVLINNHTKVWGSYWENNRWGYRCCKSFSKESFCPESPAPQCPEPPAPQRKQSRKSRRNKKKQVSSEKNS